MYTRLRFLFLVKVSRDVPREKSSSWSPRIASFNQVLMIGS